MTREQALQTAKANHEAHTKAMIDGMFGRGPVLDDNAELEQFGYRHGWYRVGEFSFCPEQITGIPYDHTQGGWAYL